MNGRLGITEPDRAEPTSRLIQWNLLERIGSLRCRKLTAHVGILLLTTFAWMAVWAIADVLVVVHAIPPPFNVSRDYVTWYWLAAWDVLFPIATLSTFRGHAWLPLMGLTAGGWEDTLFYWVQGRNAPAAYYVAGLSVLATVVVLELIAEVAKHNLLLERRVPWSSLILVLVVAGSWPFDGARFTLLFPLVYGFTFLMTKAVKRLEVVGSWST